MSPLVVRRGGLPHADARQRLDRDFPGCHPTRLPDYDARFDLARFAQRFIFSTDSPGVPGIRTNAEALAALDWPADTLAGVLWRNPSAAYRLGDLS